MADMKTSGVSVTDVEKNTKRSQASQRLRAAVKAGAEAAVGSGIVGGLARKAFAMGGKTMTYDRGRYKESGNVGSVNEKKGSGFLQTVKRGAQATVGGAKEAVKNGAEMGKAIGATMKANANLRREKGIAAKQDAARAAKNKPTGGLAKPAYAASIGAAIGGRAKMMKDIEKQYK